MKLPISPCPLRKRTLSLSEVERRALVVTDVEVITIHQTLIKNPPSISLDGTRTTARVLAKLKAKSILAKEAAMAEAKITRRETITFIRARTVSRVAEMERRKEVVSVDGGGGGKG